MPKWAKFLIGLIAIVILIVVGFLIYINTAFISKDDVKENLAKHLNVSKNDIYFDSIDLEMEKNQYEVDFYYNNHEYEAKIDAKEGKIIYTDFTSITTNSPENQNTPEITLEKAKELALKHANLDESNTTLVKAREEIDDGIAIYEIEYKDNTYEYDFDISKSGEILNYDKDRLYD